jgi:hypothetical protein
MGFGFAFIGDFSAPFLVLCAQCFNYNMTWEGCFLALSIWSINNLLYLGDHITLKTWDGFCCHFTGCTFYAFSLHSPFMTMINRFGLLMVSHRSCMFYSYFFSSFSIYPYLHVLMQLPCLQTLKICVHFDLDYWKYCQFSLFYLLSFLFPEFQFYFF